MQFMTAVILIILALSIYHIGFINTILVFFAASFGLAALTTCSITIATVALLFYLGLANSGIPSEWFAFYVAFIVSLFFFKGG